MITAVITSQNKKLVNKRTSNSLDFCSEVIYLIDRNIAIKKAKNKWILFLENDEIIDKKLAKEIQKAIKLKSFDCYYIKRRIKYINKWHLDQNIIDSPTLLLGKKGLGYWENNSWELDGNAGVIKNSIIKIKNPSLSDYIVEINNYTDNRSRELFYEEEDVNLAKIIYLAFRKFIKEYILNRKIFKGLEGFIDASLISFSVFVLYEKLWLLKQNNPNPDNP